MSKPDWKTVLGVVLGLTVALAARVSVAESITAETIYDATGVQGGLVVHLECGNGELTAALLADDRYLVQGLDADAADVVETREYLQSRNLYGVVSVATFDGRTLPYANDLVNLVVAEQLGHVTMKEIHRVLAPGGVAYIRQDQEWEMTVKPTSPHTDQWSHFLHDASGNAVAQDTRVGPPKRLRWVAHPRWCRSHEYPSSVNAVVVAGGRVFTIFDEGPTGIYRNLPQKCSLIARDANNGVFLWKAPMRQWQPDFGTGVGGRWNIHHTIPRRLVATDDRVYVTLQFLDSPVSVLDAATGEALQEPLSGTQGADEIILSDGVLVAKLTKERSVAATARVSPESLNDALVGVDVSTGEPRWRKDSLRILPYALAAEDGRVVYHNTKELVCLDLESGVETWRSPNIVGPMLGGESTLVIADGVVLFHGRNPVVGTSAGKKGRTEPVLTALSLDDGEHLWKRKGSRSLAAACTQPTDLFVARGLVWCGGSLDGYDLHTGDVQQTLSLDELISPGHHYRCHRGKATERFLIWPKRGAEFIDLEGGEHMRHDWLRAPCFTGATPANGLFYVPPSPCFCYPGVKVSGFLAMASGASESLEPAADISLERGKAYGTVATSVPASPGDWPMHRRDAQRSGAAKAAGPEQLAVRWSVDLASQGSQPVIVGNRLWVAEKDAHRIRCLNARNGQHLWSYTAGGRIDSSPTVCGGLVLFGCQDGSVYCLRAGDGELVWRFQVAPNKRQVVAYGQLESVWPIHGSILVQDGVAYFAAGRSSFLDGGIRVCGVDIASGELRCRHDLEGPWPDVSEDVGTPFAMEGALTDLLVSDGKDLYMQRIKFDTSLNRLDTVQESSLGELDMGANHLVATGGFLDDTGFDRIYWMYSKRWPGFYFSQQAPKSGQLVVFDDDTTFAVKYFYRRIQWSPAFFPAEHGYLLFADDNHNDPVLLDKKSPVQAIDWLPEEVQSDKHRRGGRGVEKGTGYVRAQPAKWQTMIPLRVRAMVLAGSRLYAVGPPDVLDADDPLATFENRKGAEIHVYSATDGSLLGSLPCSSPPAFDGLSIASGHLYLATTDGKVICFGDGADTPE